MSRTAGDYLLNFLRGHAGKYQFQTEFNGLLIYRFKYISVKFIYSEEAIKFCEIFTSLLTVCTGKSLSEAPLFAEHGENMLHTKIVLNVRNSFCAHVFPRFELRIFMY